MISRMVSMLFLLSWSPTPTLAEEVSALPGVDTVMTRATWKANDFAEQAREMQRRVANRQEESKKELTQRKEKYERHLKAQADLNTDMSTQSAALNESIAKQRRKNAQLLRDTHALQKKKADLRRTIAFILTKVKTAQKFLMHTLAETDDTGAAELKVLQPTTPVPTLEQFLSVAASNVEVNEVLPPLRHRRSSAPEDLVQKRDVAVAPALLQKRDVAVAPALLQVSSRLRHRRSSAPEDLVQVLSRSLAEIADAQKEADAQLQDRYKERLAVSQRRYADLLQVRDGLNATLAALQQEERELAQAQKHLETTTKDLEDRLAGLRKFAIKVDELAEGAVNTPQALARHKSKDSEGSALLEKSAVTSQAVAKPRVATVQSATAANATGVSAASERPQQAVAKAAAKPAAATTQSATAKKVASAAVASERTKQVAAKATVAAMNATKESQKTREETPASKATVAAMNATKASKKSREETPASKATVAASNATKASQKTREETPASKAAAKPTAAAGQAAVAKNVTGVAAALERTKQATKQAIAKAAHTSDKKVTQEVEPASISRSWRSWFSFLR